MGRLRPTTHAPSTGGTLPRVLRFALAAILCASFAFAGLPAAADVVGEPVTRRSPSTSTTATPAATTSLTFVRAFAGTTEDGTPVFIYVPEGALAGVEGVAGLDPLWDPNTDDFTPCAGGRARRLPPHPGADRRSSATSSSAQRATPASSRSTSSTSARSATPTAQPRVATSWSCWSTTSPTRAYYDCAQDDLHRRVLRAGLHRRRRDEHDRDRRLRLGRTASATQSANPEGVATSTRA